MPSSPTPSVRVVRTDVNPPIRTLKEAVYGAVDTARHHIYLENPYFNDQILDQEAGGRALAGRRRPRRADHARRRPHDEQVHRH